MFDVADQVCPEHRKKFEEVSLSRRTVAHRIEAIGEDQDKAAFQFSWCSRAVFTENFYVRHAARVQTSWQLWSTIDVSLTLAANEVHYVKFIKYCFWSLCFKVYIKYDLFLA